MAQVFGGVASRLRLEIQLGQNPQDPLARLTSCVDGILARYEQERPEQMLSIRSSPELPDLVAESYESVVHF
jgi:hypothetical protein